MKVQNKCNNVSATCYGIQAKERYDVEVVDYGHLADDLDNIESLGNRACADVKLCFRQVRKAIKVKLYFDTEAGYSQFKQKNEA